MSTNFNNFSLCSFWVCGCCREVDSGDIVSFVDEVEHDDDDDDDEDDGDRTWYKSGFLICI